MLFRLLLPSKFTFFDLFEEHAALIHKAAVLLEQQISLEEYRNSAVQEIHVLDNEADQVRRHCLEELHKVFITPIDRDEIYRLINALDELMDCVHTAANTLVMYKIEGTTAELVKFAKLVLLAIQPLHQAIQELRSIENREIIKQQCIAIHAAEREADYLLREAVGKLFVSEMKTIEIMKWKEIYEILEATTDRSSDVADLIEGIMLEMY